MKKLNFIFYNTVFFFRTIYLKRQFNLKNSFILLVRNVNEFLTFFCFTYCFYYYMSLYLWWYILTLQSTELLLILNMFLLNKQLK